MVEAPRTTSPSRTLRSCASCIASQSNPRWLTNFASSLATTARLRLTEMREYGIH